MPDPEVSVQIYLAMPGLAHKLVRVESCIEMQWQYYRH